MDTESRGSKETDHVDTRERLDSKGTWTRLDIGGQPFLLGDRLGGGSFGDVWRAVRCQPDPVRDSLSESAGEQGQVAVKEILCRSGAALEAANFEVELLRAFGGDAEGAGVGVPALLAAETESLGPSIWRRRLAMSWLPGEPLLRGLQDGTLVCDGIVQAGSFVYAMLSQLVPILERVSARIFHRDLHARNIVVAAGIDSKAQYRFGLLDFGLAVDAERWRDRGGWWRGTLAGDPRYWTVSAWLACERGPSALMEREELALEYRTQLDFHSLGLTAVQALVALPRQAEQDPHTGDGDAVISAFHALREAWARYWCVAEKFHAQLRDAVSVAGCRQELAEAMAHKAVAARCGDLRLQLTALRQACGEASSEGRGLAELRVTLDGLLSLVSDGSRPHVPPSWRGVLNLLAGNSLAAELVQEPGPTNPQVGPEREAGLVLAAGPELGAGTVCPETAAREVQSPSLKIQSPSQRIARPIVNEFYFEGA